jgi:hypothetical protein
MSHTHFTDHINMINHLPNKCNFQFVSISNSNIFYISSNLTPHQ